MAKHVIMFADAQDSEQQEDCVAMAKQMFEREHITTSVIGMGTPSDPHWGFQQDVAAAGHGRSAITDDVMQLPKLFAKEAFIVSRNAFVEKKEGIVPRLYQSPLLEGFVEHGIGGVPRIYGYVGTTLKPRAALAMHGVEAEDPLLAHWVIGLGKVRGVHIGCDESLGQGLGGVGRVCEVLVAGGAVGQQVGAEFFSRHDDGD